MNSPHHPDNNNESSGRERTIHGPALDAQPEGSWGELFSGRTALAVFVLAGGVALFAVNVYLTASLLPSAVTEIGGERMYAGSATAFLIGSVLSSTTVSSIATAWGPRHSYWLALGFFGLGTGVCGCSVTMGELLAGKALQGIGGGMLSTLGYAMINSVLPERVWRHASGLISGMWGVGTCIGPIAGGIFSQAHAWRWAFFTVVMCVAGIAIVTPFAFPKMTAHTSVTTMPSAGSLTALLAATVAASVSSTASSFRTLCFAVLGTIVLMIVFLLVDARVERGVFPRITYRDRSTLPWLYLAMGSLTAATAVELYVPLFAQRLGHMMPVTAGFVGALMAVGWTCGEFPSVSITRSSRVRTVLIGGPLVTALCMVLAGMMSIETSQILFAAALFIGGCGIGIAWPHLTVLVLRATQDPEEGSRAAAGISISQMVVMSMAAAFAGLLVTGGGPSYEGSSHALFLGMSSLCGLAFVGIMRVLAMKPALLNVNNPD